jgi:CrcB protein
MLESRGLLASDHVATSGAYLLASVLTGLAAVWAGAGAVRLVTKGRKP